jgi:hypothetical protein
MGDFDDFAQSLQRFERRLVILVTASIAYGAVVGLIQYSTFDVSFQTLTGLVCTIMGIAGVLPRYLASLRNSRQETDFILLYQPEKHHVWVAPNFILSVVALCVYYPLVRAQSFWCVVFAAISSYLFFSALTTSHLIIQTRDRQELLWNVMSVEQRTAWSDRQIERINQELKRDEEMQRIEDDLQRSTAALLGTVATVNENLQRHRKDRRRRRIWRAFEKIYHFTFELRRKIWRGLLTQREATQLQLLSCLSQNWSPSPCRNVIIRQAGGGTHGE